jgi:hypothetical protein
MSLTHRLILKVTPLVAAGYLSISIEAAEPHLLDELSDQDQLLWSVNHPRAPMKGSIEPYKYPLFYKATRLGPVDIRVGSGAAFAWELYESMQWRTGLIVQRRQQIGSSFLLLGSQEPIWTLQTGPMWEF